MITKHRVVALKESGVRSDDDGVRQASTKYYAALNRLLQGEAEPLMNVWSHEADVTAMNPYGGREVGWAQLCAVFRRVAQLCAGSQIRVTLHDSVIRVGGDLAYEVGTERGEGTIAGKPTVIAQRVTNIYRREAGGWKLVHRHADLNPAEHDVAARMRAVQG